MFPGNPQKSERSETSLTLVAKRRPAGEGTVRAALSVYGTEQNNGGVVL